MSSRTPVGAAVATARAALAAVLASAPHTSDAELTESIVDAESLVRLVQSFQASLVAEADRRALGRVQGARDTATWLQDRLKLDPGQARARVEVARASDGPSRKALSDGVISLDHARVIATCLRKLPASAAGDVAKVERVLTERARWCRPGDLRRLADGVNATYDRDTAVRDEQAQYESRELHYVTTDDGMVMIKARLDKETGQKFIAALRPVSKPCPATNGQPDPRTPAQRHADGLATLVDLALGSDRMPRVGGQRVQVQVTVDYDDLVRSLDPDAEGVVPGVFADGVPITTDNVRRLACDAGILPIVLGGDGVAVDYGREERTAPPAQRAALFRRDGVCAFPGCEHPPGTSQAHHIRHWLDGGTTDLTNMVMLCAFHHRTLHHDHWNITMQERRPVFTPPAHVDPQRTPLPGGTATTAVHQRMIRDLVPKPREPEPTHN
ncbi:HNH endonuclease signature motif containing protein [Saccharopolyspora dendranthemae]|uniref:HNH endonuclease signature motif containing protein n=1 Tax=Saccharopolyspora dendranthemae TaxID=1181886 RepID=UPI0011A9CFF2|nr:HNH endonuclease signature motif containing protein [Saccharopolyspora dendranthemae]